MSRAARQSSVSGTTCALVTTSVPSPTAKPVPRNWNCGDRVGEIRAHRDDRRLDASHGGRGIGRVGRHGHERHPATATSALTRTPADRPRTRRRHASLSGVLARCEWPRPGSAVLARCAIRTMEVLPEAPTAHHRSARSPAGAPPSKCRLANGARRRRGTRRAPATVSRCPDGARPATRATSHRGRERRPAADRDIVDLVDRVGPARQRREHVGLHDVGHMAEVARRRTVAVDRHDRPSSIVSTQRGITAA